MRDLIVTQDEWVEHRRPDGERIGWMRPEGEDFVPVDLLGRDLSSATDWLSAEHALSEAGIGYLADPYELLLDDGTWQRVRLVEVSPTLIRLKKENFGAIGGPRMAYTLPFPAPETLELLALGRTTSTRPTSNRGRPASTTLTSGLRRNWPLSKEEVAFANR